VLPAEPWKATGRWQVYGNEVFKLEDRHGREMMLGPTEEEVFAPLVAGDLPSYRDLPINLYQVEWKYRDEKRPRFGLLRGREFLMKDAYTFDRDEQGLAASYRTMYEAYERVFDRIGFDYAIVEADPGSIGGDINHEFMALADVGEDLFVRCRNGDYLADTEAATPMAPPPLSDPELDPLVEVDTPGAATIELVARQLGIGPERTLKNILFDVGGRTVAVLVPGDREVSQKKLARLHFPEVVRPFDDDDFARLGYAKGYVGPHGFGDDVTVFADPAVRAGANWVTGANRPDVHVTGANLDRDFRVDRWEDLVELREGDRCPVDGGELEIGRSIVVGHIYQLGTRYSEPLGATFQDEDGADKPYLMGSYGIGITRILAALVEQHHDELGIVWPAHLAPCQVVVVMANADDDRVLAEASRIHDELAAAGVDTMLDDRDERAGVKFADADLVGYPVQITVGKRGLAEGKVDLKLRATGERSEATLEGAVRAAIDLLATAP
jgi:prolyl-tRNA synthetase